MRHRLSVSEKSKNMHVLELKVYNLSAMPLTDKHRLSTHGSIEGITVFKIIFWGGLSLSIRSDVN